MAKKTSGANPDPVGTRSTASQTSTSKAKVRDAVESFPATRQKPSALVDTRVICCGDNLEQLKKLPDASVDLVYPDPPAWPKPLRRGEGPPFNSNADYSVLFRE